MLNETTGLVKNIMIEITTLIYAKMKAPLSTIAVLTLVPMLTQWKRQFFVYFETNRDLMDIWKGIRNLQGSIDNTLRTLLPYVCYLSITTLLANNLLLHFSEQCKKCFSFVQNKIRASHGVSHVLFCHSYPIPGSSLGQLRIHAERMPGWQDGSETCCSQRLVVPVLSWHWCVTHMYFF